MSEALDENSVVTPQETPGLPQSASPQRSAISTQSGDSQGNDSEPTSSKSSSVSSNDYELVPNPAFFGEPVQIVKVTGERKFELDSEALGNILLRDVIRDTPVVVVSIAGDFRKGKEKFSKKVTH